MLRIIGVDLIIKNLVTVGKDSIINRYSNSKVNRVMIDVKTAKSKS